MSDLLQAWARMAALLAPWHVAPSGKARPKGQAKGMAETVVA